MSQSQYSEDQSGGWIQWFCGLEDHHYFCQVEQQFIRDNFNLYGIKQKFNHYSEALEMILRPDPPDDQELQDQRFLEIYQQATDIYGLIHARFILTNRGLNLMRQKFQMGKFGICPRVLCQRQNVLPIGMSQEIRTSRVKIYCPKCQDVYIPKKKCQDVDGAYFGCSFPHVLLQTFSELQPQPTSISYVPRIYGFRIFKRKGSRFQQQKKSSELTHYSEQQLKKIKGKMQMRRRQDDQRKR